MAARLRVSHALPWMRERNHVPVQRRVRRRTAAQPNTPNSVAQAVPPPVMGVGAQAQPESSPASSEWDFTSPSSLPPVAELPPVVEVPPVEGEGFVVVPPAPAEPPLFDEPPSLGEPPSPGEPPSAGAPPESLPPEPPPEEPLEPPLDALPLPEPPLPEPPVAIEPPVDAPPVDEPPAAEPPVEEPPAPPVVPPVPPLEVPPAPPAPPLDVPPVPPEPPPPPPSTQGQSAGQFQVSGACSSAPAPTTTMSTVSATLAAPIERLSMIMKSKRGRVHSMPLRCQIVPMSCFM
jgi:hypothetical protein